MVELDNQDQTQKQDKKVEAESQNPQLEDKEQLKSARKKLHKGVLEQKETTKELQRQGEKLDYVEGEAVSVQENVERGRKTAKQIKKEQRFFKFPNVIGGIKNFFSRSRKKEANIDKKNKEANEDTVETENSEENLKLMLNDIKKMRGEVDTQNKEIKKQKLNVKHISKLNKNSDHIMNKTSQEMRKL